MSKPVPYLTLAEAFTRLTQIKEKDNAGAASFVIHGKQHSLYSVCKLEVDKASAASVYKGVSRGGQPVIIASRTAKPDPLLTIDEVLAQLQQFITEFGGNVPFLAKNSDYHEFQLCDIWPGTAGATNVLKSVSRGGQRVAAVAFYVPDK